MMAQHETTYEQLLADALDLLGDMQQRMGMFERQDYWKIKLKAESLKQKEMAGISALSGVTNK